MAALCGAAVFAMVLPAAGQNPQLQQRVAEIRQALAANRQALALYTWQERQTVIINGEVKKQDFFQVRARTFELNDWVD